MTYQIGVLALQGSYRLHQPHIEAAGHSYVEVREQSTLCLCDGIILPGGESGVILKSLKQFNLLESLRQFVRDKPSWGICAGAILLAENAILPDGRAQESLEALDMTIRRNSYGRQLESFQTEIYQQPVSFIRAPKITITGPSIKTLHHAESGPTWVSNSKTMATTFHPELVEKKPSFFHQKFFEKLKLLERDTFPNNF